MLTATMIKRANTISRTAFLKNNPNLRQITQYNALCHPSQRVTRKQYIAIRDAMTETRITHTTARWFGVNPNRLFDIAFNKSCAPNQRIA